MKKLQVLFAAAVMLMSAGIAKAQKLATMDVASILSAMPEKKKADDQLAAFSASKQAEIKKQQESAQALFTKYQSEAEKQTPETNKARQAELEKLQENLQKMMAAAQKDMADRQDAAFAPIEKKFMDAVTRAAKANGWDYVMDANSPVLIYKGGTDATAAVKKELGL